MPFPFKRNPEDAPDGDPASHLAQHATIRPHALTEELLEWVLAALEAVLRTPQLQDQADRRTAQALREAYRYADYLWPLTVDMRARTTLWELEHRDTGVGHAHQVREEQGLVLGLEGALQEPREGHGSDEGGDGPWVQAEGA